MQPVGASALIPRAVTVDPLAMGSKYAPGVVDMVCQHEHHVQFYDSEEFLSAAVCAFLAPAFRDENAAIVVATAAHRRAFDNALGGAGIDLDAAIRAGRYLAFDADGLLSKFMVQGMPDARRFRDTIGSVMNYVAQDGREIRICGEMVAVLCERGEGDAALALEDLWNQLAGEREFELLCAYPMRAFADSDGAAAFERVCERHKGVSPCEDFPPLAAPADQSRAVAQLQQELVVLARDNERSQRTSSILDAAGEGIIGADANGIFTFANSAALRMTGYEPEEMRGHDLHDLLHHTHADGTPFPREECAAQASLADGSANHCDQDIFWRKDGTSFPIELTSTAIVDGSRTTGAVVVFRDISQRLETERVQGQFTAIVSHELRTPLTSIRAALGLLAGGVLGPMPEEGRRMVEIAVQNTDRLVRLVNDLLDLERIDGGSIALRSERCDCVDVIDRAVEALLATAAGAQVSIEIDARPAAFAADADRVIQTLMNLIANAVKFSPPRGTVRITAAVRDDEVLFEVSDDGRGIPAEQVETIFERFAQVSSSDAREKGGTGLGLAICRSIVERHGGRIWARSVVGEGSTFSFVLPVARPVT